MWSTPSISFLARASDASKVFLVTSEQFDGAGTEYGSAGTP